MKIIPVNNINFTARKPEIRKADDLQRKSRREFPMLSSSYVNDFYLSTGKYRRITKKKNQLFNHLCDCVTNNTRAYTDKKVTRDNYIPCVTRLKALKKYKTGNCMEAAYATAATLFANGYKNTDIASLMYKAEFYNKRTKALVHTSSVSLDHSFVITDMNKKDGKQDIVIDSWLGFADSIEGAIARYKKIKDDSTINKAIQLIASEIYAEFDVPIDEILSEYDVKGKMIIVKDSILTTKNKNDIGEFAKEHFSQLV